MATINDEIDPKVMQRLVLKIIKMERDNLKSEQFTPTQMAGKILKLIQEQVKE